jgi:hypothetical protein
MTVGEFMEEKFLSAVETARTQAAALGVRIRPVDMKGAKRCLSGNRESDGFWQLADLHRLDLSLEALAVKKQFTALFTDEEANTALTRLLSAGYTF